MPNPSYGYPAFALYLAFIVINFLTFLDRAIIPATSKELLELIAECVPLGRPNIFLGCLQSSFIVGFTVASIVFSKLTRVLGSFRVCAIGLSFWVIASAGASLSLHYHSFWGLLVARMVSGVGEASFVGFAAPWIAANAPPKARGTWLAIFYTAIPVGTAVGYTYASYAADHMGNNWTFICQAVCMMPIVFIFLHAAQFHPPFFVPSPLPPTPPPTPGGGDESFFTAAEPPSHAGADSGHDRYVQLSPPPDESFDRSALDLSALPIQEIVIVPAPAPTNVADDLKVVVRRPVYACITMGCAAQVAVTAGLGCFGPSFLMGLELFDTEPAAASSFGAIVLLAGVIGTPLGGVLADACQSCARAWDVPADDMRDDMTTTTTATKSSSSGGHGDGSEMQSGSDESILPATYRSIQAMMALVATFIFAAAVCLCTTYVATERDTFLLLVTAGCTLIFMCNPAINLALMASVPVPQRPLALALTSVCVHLFGDVPSPVITGILRDLFCDDSGSGGSGGGSSDALWVSPRTPSAYMLAAASSVSQKLGIRVTMLLVCAWLLVAFCFYCAAYSFARRGARGPKHPRAERPRGNTPRLEEPLLHEAERHEAVLNELPTWT
jgi:MFS family permease